MKVQYIFHSGFLVETAAGYYLFDYYKGDLPRLDTDKPMVVFSSHSHGDHYNPEVFSILKEMGMKDIFAVLAKDIPPRNHPADIEVLRADAGQTYPLPHGEQLETLLSNDSGVAFLLTAAEGVIYHAGDLNDWTWDGESEQDNQQMRDSYRQEIDKLKGRRIDIAFVPLDPRQEMYYAEGMKYFLAQVGAGKVYPMHYWEDPGIIRQFLQAYPQYQDIVAYAER